VARRREGLATEDEEAPLRDVLSELGVCAGEVRVLGSYRVSVP
jgi:hypothetical protein